MKTVTIRIASLALLLFFLSSASLAEERVLNIFNWADYVAPQTIAQFENEFGIRVNYDTYDNGLMVDARMLAGRSGYDVVLQGGFDAERLVPLGMYLPLNKSKLPNLRHMDQDLMSKVTLYDPDNRHGVIFMWGSVGYAFNVEKIRKRMPDAPLTSSAMLFDPEVVSRFADCGVSFLDEAGGMISLALQYLGYSGDTNDLAHLAEAEAVLKAVRPYIRYFSSSKSMMDLPSGETCLAVTWSGDFGQSKARADDAGTGVKLAYEVPRQGSDLWFDMWWIPSDAPHPDNAHLFLNFMMRPEVIADNSNFTVYANANTASIPYLLPEVYHSKSAYPPQDILDILHANAPRTLKEERVRTRIWARVKSGF
jgi:putrescine transport system substrate-binding protein